LGLDAIQQPEEVHDRTLTRAERIAYKGDLNLLDQLLTEVYQYTSPEGNIAFSIKPRLYQKLSERLRKVEDTVYRQDPSINANNLPNLPSWGPYARDLQYWNSVDFEIIGANYRLQVENFFVALLDQVYAKKEKDEPQKGKEREGGPASSSQIPSSSTPY
jgi:hypothetical protein